VKFILLSDNGRQSHTVDTHSTKFKLLAIAALLLVLVAGATAYQAFQNISAVQSQVNMKSQWQASMSAQEDALETVQQQVQSELQALTMRVAQLQAGMLRLDALGEQIAQVANLDNGEFDFSKPPALGGPSLATTGDVNAPNVYQLIAEMEALVEDRSGQFSVMDGQLIARSLKQDSFVAGRPVKSGWMSSRFGHRADPFTGKQAWHNGVDFAGKAGADVISVAAGVITSAERRYGYGNMVEINHGNGFVTRYAHNAENLVGKGDVVKKGAVIAKMGNTGRSTGPHVHFEVFKGGKPSNPERYIYRASL
jgi:murein DD-endopeptidase MepM/ murein hydrolase activator NlpD